MIFIKKYGMIGSKVMVPLRITLYTIILFNRKRDLYE